MQFTIKRLANAQARHYAKKISGALNPIRAMNK